MKRVYVGVIAGQYCIDTSGKRDLHGPHSNAYATPREFRNALHHLLKDRKLIIEIQRSTKELEISSILEAIQQTGLLQRVIDITQNSTSLKHRMD